MIALTSWWRTCVCGCARSTHKHLRHGSDCGRCGAAECPRFHRRIDWAAWMPAHHYEQRGGKR